MFYNFRGIKLLQSTTLNIQNYSEHVSTYHQISKWHLNLCKHDFTIIGPSEINLQDIISNCQMLYHIEIVLFSHKD